MDGYDVIGDVHGHADKLVGLLRGLGYAERQGAWRHSERTAVFVGDLIDRGTQQLETIRIGRAMAESGSATIVLGNHEFNALAYTTWNEQIGDYCRSRTGSKGRKHYEQHEAFLTQVGIDTPAARDALSWFRTIPLWLDLGELRVVHACWNVDDIEHLTTLVGPTGGVTDRIVIDGTTDGHRTHRAIETLIKGPEIDLDGRVYLDKGGHRRNSARLRWWEPTADTMRGAAVIPAATTGIDGLPFPPLPEDPLRDSDAKRYSDDIPVIVGHYWAKGRPTVLAPMVACVDYSAGTGGPLVAYRWSGEHHLTDAHFACH